MRGGKGERGRREGESCESRMACLSRHGEVKRIGGGRAWGGGIRGPRQAQTPSGQNRRQHGCDRMVFVVACVSAGRLESGRVVRGGQVCAI